MVYSEFRQGTYFLGAADVFKFIYDISTLETLYSI
jgi:hypothetical protein